MRTSFNPHTILGLQIGAKPAAIRKAYHRLALENHPDKFGHSDAATQALAAENTKIINRAYKILTDKEERKAWEDSLMEVSQNDFQNLDNPQISSNAERPSAPYKRYFEILEECYRSSPLERLTKSDLEKAFEELHELSSNESFGAERYRHLYRSINDGAEYSDLHQFIAHLEECQAEIPLDADFFNENLNPEKAIDFLLGFLQGKHYGQNLKSIQNYFQTQCARLYQLNNPLLTLYQSIAAILNTASIEKDYPKVLNALEGIYAFAYQQNKTDKNNITNLIQDRCFRYLVANAHRYFWKDDKHIIDASLFTKIKGEYSRYRKNLSFRLSAINIEDKILKIFSKEVDLTELYDCAYLLMDLSDCQIPQSYRINSLILAALCFQLAAQKETEQSKAMAAEHLALCLYQKAMSNAHQSDATIALYAATQIAKYASELVYNPSVLSETERAKLLFQPGDAGLIIHTGSAVDTIKGAVKKSLYIIDIFPLYTSLKSMIDLELIGIYQAAFIRSLLQSLLIQEQSPSRHDHTKLVYHAYEDAIKKLYDETQTEQEERWINEIKFKSRAIDLLVRRDNGNPDDMVKLIDQPYIHMQRDVGGWFIPNGELDFPDEANITIYKSFDGYEAECASGFETKFGIKNELKLSHNSSFL